MWPSVRRPSSAGTTSCRCHYGRACSTVYCQINNDKVHYEVLHYLPRNLLNMHSTSIPLSPRCKLQFHSPANIGNANQSTKLQALQSTKSSIVSVNLFFTTFHSVFQLPLSYKSNALPKASNRCNASRANPSSLYESLHQVLADAIMPLSCSSFAASMA